MEEIVFKLFERQPNWSLRNLIQETDQPEVCALSSFTLKIWLSWTLALLQAKISNLYMQNELQP